MTALATGKTPRSVLVQLACIGLVIATCASALIGWCAGIEPLVRWVPVDARMAFSTAVVGILGAIGMIAHFLKRPMAGMVAGVLVATAGALGLADGLFGAVRLAAGSWVGLADAPGRMAPGAGIGFVLIGASLVLLPLKAAPRWVIAGFAGIILAVAVLPLLILATVIVTDAPFETYHAMPVPTCGCLAAMAILIFLRVGESVEREAIALPVMAAALGMLLSISVVAVQGNGDLLQSNHDVGEAYQVRGAVDRLVEEVARMESSERAYALTGEDLFLNRANTHQADIQRQLHDLAPLVASNKSLAPKVAELGLLAEEKFEQGERMVQLRRTSGQAAASQYLTTLLAAPGRPTSDLVRVADEIRAQEDELLAARVEIQRSIERNSRVVQAFGTVFAMALLAVAIRSNRRVTAARKAAEDDLARAEQQFRNAFEDAGVGMALVGLDGRWLRANRGICDMLGYSEAELMARSFQELTHPDDLNADLEKVKWLMNGGGTSYRMEKRYFHKDGRTIWGNLTVSLVRDMSGAPMRFIAQVENINARKELETRLLSARDEALMASRLKSEFLATMSHEIRTPMNGVLGMLGLLSESRLDDEQQEMARVIQTSAESLLGVIDEILDFSKIEAGQLRLESVKFDLCALVGETLALHGPRAHQKGIELVAELDPSVRGSFSGDPGRVRQILSNLVGNALKFTERGEVVVKADLGRENALWLSVRDTGIGIPREAHSRLFQSFTQVDGSVTRRFGGTGLGLAISKQLVALMGGEIAFTSEPGIGSEFFFHVALPFVPADPGPQYALPEKCRILLIDDNETTRRVVLRMLKEAGLLGRAVAGCSEAMELLKAASKEQRPDVVLLDCHLPEAAFFAEMLHTAHDGVFAGIPLIGLSFTGALEPLTKAKIPIKTYLPKPLREAQLMACLARLFNGGGTLSPWTASPAAAQPPSKGHSLLVVEDNLANQAVARTLLRRMGHSVDVASDGFQALEMLKRKRYEAVLMDCQMPRLDGYETTRRIRSGEIMEIDPRVPVIAITAYAMPEDRAKCLASGMDDYVTKPLSAEALRAALARCRLAGGTEVTHVRANEPKAAESDVLDPRVVAMLKGLPGKRASSLWPETVAVFLNEEPLRFAEIEQNFADYRAQPLAIAAHTLGSSCATLGAMPMRDLALALERVARSEDWPRVESGLAELKAASKRLRSVLEVQNPS